MEVRQHPDHAGACVTLTQVLSAGDLIAVVPQVSAKFIHVVTDPRRFADPLDMSAARHVAEQWWTASDVVQAFSDAGGVGQLPAVLPPAPMTRPGGYGRPEHIAERFTRRFTGCHGLNRRLISRAPG